MCGRYALNSFTLETLHSTYPFINPSRFQDEERFRGRYNIAPRSYAPVIRHDGDQTIVQAMRWGVVPHYNKSDDGSLKTINARGEHLSDGTSSLWDSLKRKKRALIPVQGYYEWLKASSTNRVPHFTKHQNGKLMMLAGLWDVVQLQDHSAPLYTFTIITTSSSKQLSFLHDRMPVILDSKTEIELWLSSSDWNENLSNLIAPSNISFKCYPVPPEVGKVGMDDASFILPVSKRKDGIEVLLKKQHIKASKRGVSEVPSVSGHDNLEQPPMKKVKTLASSPNKTQKAPQNLPQRISDSKITSYFRTKSPL